MVSAVIKKKGLVFTLFGLEIVTDHSHKWCKKKGDLLLIAD